MAERRMFAKTIIDSDAFLDMPLSTQALYFHLSMRGDDEGFVNNPKKIARMLGAGDDELKVLVAKKFIILFDSGVIVIKHWKIHNYIRGDRIKDTNYTDERDMLATNENGSYTFIDVDVGQLSDTCPSNDSVGKDRLGKDRLGKDKKERDTELPECINPTVWDEWKQHRKEIKKTLTPLTIKKQIAQLEKFHKLGMDTSEVIYASITNGWAGLFAVRKGAHQTNGNGHKTSETTAEAYERYKQEQNGRNGAIDAEVSE